MKNFGLTVFFSSMFEGKCSFYACLGAVQIEEELISYWTTELWELCIIIASSKQLTRFRSMLSFCTSWKHQKIFGFLFSRGGERKHLSDDELFLRDGWSTKGVELYSSRGYCCRLSPSPTYEKPRVGFEPVQNLSSDFGE